MEGSFDSNSTTQFGITFQQGSGIQFEVFASSDFASKATDRKSVSGSRVICWGAAVSWFFRT